MKKIFTLFGLLTFTILSCNKDFIELTPPDQVSGKTFYQTEDQFRQALATAYVPLRNLLIYDMLDAEMRSDNTYYENFSVNRGDGFVQRENIADFTNSSSNGYTNGSYFACYTGISRCNMITDKIRNSAISDAAKNEIEGQVKFLRAFFYFKLVRYFGGVPLFLKEVKVADDAFLTRSTVDEVYNQIISDAKDAIGMLQPPAKFPQTGLATKGAATMLLADVYLTQKKYAEAEGLLKTLPAMGYDLNPNYADAFSTSNKNSKESVFEVQYNEGLTNGQQSNFIYQFLPRSTNTTVITGVRTDNSASGGYNIPTEDIIKAYEPGDKRLDASIAVAEGSYNQSMIFTFSANKGIINYIPVAGKVGVPYIKKYLHTHSNANNTNDNWPIYRYAESLLSLAETLNEQGKSGEALPYLNKVRNRAGLSTVTITDQTELRGIIAHERRVELAFENKRWHDLVRTGQAIQVMTNFGIALKQRVNYVPANAFALDQTKLIYPIPNNEININPKLIQNPGYF
ncbi:RagB/SusD family nutrient uptake outer membrane protein [Pedobacter heparinus]|uniref:RagB/SusD family nutrient uptake outer membrane protein n=1 Tax=Pedobacter heparinus TaxID=984 RepID=UPI002931BACE|nr:RagB/SusD family nutrient uptake outer membrane protein [Pedobacter heparinus]